MSRRAEGGFVLVLALWLLAGLAALAAAYSMYARAAGPSAALPEERLKAEAALRAGVALVALRQLSWPKSERPDFGAFSEAVGDVRIDAVYRSESGRVDLNSAPPELLAGLFVQIGAAKPEAAFLAERIVAWRGKLTGAALQRETAIYAKAGLAYAPPGAPFDNALEIFALPGLSAPLARRALRFVTIFGAAKIDPLVADPVVLAALPGLAPTAVAAFLAARNGARLDTQRLTQIAGPASAYLTSEPNAHVRAEIVATLRDRRVRAEIVAKIGQGATNPYEIVYWRDDFDGDD